MNHFMTDVNLTNCLKGQITIIIKVDIFLDVLVKIIEGLRERMYLLFHCLF